MAAAKRIHFGYEEWLKAFRAKSPTAQQKRLLKIWRDIESALDGFNPDTVYNPYGFDFEKMVHELAVDEEGNITIGVNIHSTINVYLHELSDGGERAAFERDLRRLAATKQGRKAKTATTKHA